MAIHPEIRDTVTRRVSNRKRRVAIYLGRFQGFHKGQEYVLKHCLANYDEVIVGIGSAEKAPDPKDPFTYEQRRRVLLLWQEFSSHAGAELNIRPIRDRRYNDSAWVAAVQEMVANVLGRGALNSEITLVGCDRDDSTYYLRAFPQWKLDLIEPYADVPGLSATKIRERLFTDFVTPIEKWKEVTKSAQNFFIDFRETEEFWKLKRWHDALVQYKLENYTGLYRSQYITAHAAVIQSGHVLVVRRTSEIGNGLLTLPDAFVKYNQRIKEAAVSAVMNKTGIRLADGKRAEEITRDMLSGSIVAQDYFDHPTRSLRGRTVTHAFLMRLKDTKALPVVLGTPLQVIEGSDGTEVEALSGQWMDINTALSNPEWWFEDQHDILETMHARLKE